MSDSNADPGGQRLDRWLWAARLFKTRSIAADAINNGRVEFNGVRAKPAKIIRTGDVLNVRRPPYTIEIVVHGLAERRVSAKLAAALYSETEDSIQRRSMLSEQLALGAVHEQRRTGKLNKKDRRERESFKRSYGQTSD